MTSSSLPATLNVKSRLLPKIITSCAIVLTIILLSGCATPQYERAELCSDGTPGNGEEFIITAPAEGFISKYREKWPWSTGHSNVSDQTVLLLQCITPQRKTSQPYQRRAVYQVKGTQKLLFGTTDYEGTPKGVMPAKSYNQAKALEGETVWFTGSITYSVHEATNLEPYKVKAITKPDTISGGDLIMIVATEEESGDLKIPLYWDKKENKFSIPKGSFFKAAPTSQKLKVPPLDIPLIKQGKAQVGMHQNSIYHSLGFPDDINSTTYQYTVVEQWVYRSRGLYVYFDENRFVFAISKN